MTMPAKKRLGYNVRDSMETEANVPLKRKGTQKELGTKNVLRGSASSKNPMSNAQSMKSINIQPQIKKLMP